MLGAILAFIMFLASPFGVLAILLGFVSFILLGVPSRIGESKRGANALLWLSQTAAGRGAIVVSEAGETFYKTLSYNDQGLFEASFSDGKKVFEDPGNAVTRFMGKPFTLLDEKHGVAFDPRHAAVGERKREAEEKEELFVKSTDEENSTYGVRGWVRGVFSLPQNYELVELAEVRPLISGGERAEYGPRVTELYKFSRNPYRDRSSIIRLFLPVIAFLAVLGGMYVIADQAAGPSSTVGFGSLAILALPSPGAIDWRRGLKRVALVALPLGLVALLAVTVGPILTGFIVVAWVLGFILLPLATFVFGFSNKLSGAFAKLHLKLGLLGYRRPVFEWTPEGYELRESDDLEGVNGTEWYSLAGRTVGFTFIPKVDSFDEGWTAQDVENNSEFATDGGPSTNLPPGYVRSEKLKRDVYGGFVPSNPDKGRIYVKSGRFMRRLAPAATGQKSKKSLEDAREKYGLGWWSRVEGKTLAYLTFAAAMLAAIIGAWAFFL